MELNKEILDEINSISNTRLNNDEKLKKFGELYDTSISDSMITSGQTQDFVTSNRGKIMAEFSNVFQSEGIDWDSGMPQLFRGGLSRADTLEEKEDFLSRAVGKDGWYKQDDEYVIRKDPASKFVETNRDVGVDPAGFFGGTGFKDPKSYDPRHFDWGDINPVGDLAGEALPLATSVGVGAGMTGYGAVPGAITVGASAVIAKTIDEYVIENAQYGKPGGLFGSRQLQEDAEIESDVATIGATYAGGEGAGRILFGGVRWLAGPGKKMMYEGTNTITEGAKKISSNLLKKGTMWGKRGKAVMVESAEHMDIVNKLLKNGFYLDADQILPHSYPQIFTRLQKMSSTLFGTGKQKNYHLVKQMLERLGYGDAAFLKKLPKVDVHNMANQLKGMVDGKMTAMSKSYYDGIETVKLALRDSTDSILRGLGGRDIKEPAGNYFRDSLKNAYDNAREIGHAYYNKIDDVLKKNGVKDTAIVSFEGMRNDVLKLLKDRGATYGTRFYQGLSEPTRKHIDTLLNTPRATFSEAHKLRSDLGKESYNPLIAHLDDEQTLLMHLSDMLTHNMEKLPALGARFGEGGETVFQGVRGEGMDAVSSAFKNARSYYRGFKSEFDYFKLSKILTSPEDAAKSSGQIANLLLTTKNNELAKAAKNILGGRFGTQAGLKTQLDELAEAGGSSYKPDLKQVGNYRNVVRAYTKEMFHRLTDPKSGFGNEVKADAFLRELQSMYKNMSGKESDNMLYTLYGKKVGDDLLDFGRQLAGFNEKITPELIETLGRTLNKTNWEGKFTVSLRNYLKVAKEQRAFDESEFWKAIKTKDWSNLSGTKIMDMMWSPSSESLARSGMKAIRETNPQLADQIIEEGGRKFLVENMTIKGADGIDALTGAGLEHSLSKYGTKHLDSLLGTEKRMAIEEFAQKLKVLDSSQMSFSSIVTSQMPLHPLNQKGMFMKLGFVGYILNNPLVMRSLSKGIGNENWRNVAETLGRAAILSQGEQARQGGKEQLEEQTRFLEQQKAAGF